jgi:hypothetical protein
MLGLRGMDRDVTQPRFSDLYHAPTASGPRFAVGQLVPLLARGSGRTGRETEARSRAALRPAVRGALKPVEKVLTAQETCCSASTATGTIRPLCQRTVVT